MVNTFERDGISFRYPADWTAEVADDAESGGWTVTVSSPDTAFFLASLQPEASDGGELSDQTLATMKGEYKELDAEEVMETICGLPAIGFNADFLTVDTPTSCRVRALGGAAGALPRFTDDPLDRWRGFAPEATGRAVARAGHCLAEDAPGDVAADLRAFLSRP